MQQKIALINKEKNKEQSSGDIKRIVEGEKKARKRDLIRKRKRELMNSYNNDSKRVGERKGENKKTKEGLNKRGIILGIKRGQYLSMTCV